MDKPRQIYTDENVAFAYQLMWAVPIFGNTELLDLSDAVIACKPSWESKDGIQLLESSRSGPKSWKFLASTVPMVAPSILLARLKGRLQYQIRNAFPKAFRRNYRLESVASAKCKTVDKYIDQQLDRHRMSDPRVQDFLANHQIHRRDIDLSRIRYSAHGQFVYNLHLVLEQ